MPLKHFVDGNIARAAIDERCLAALDFRDLVSLA
jgi:hypothetical protein